MKILLSDSHNLKHLDERDPKLPCGFPARVLRASTQISEGAEACEDHLDRVVAVPAVEMTSRTQRTSYVAQHTENRGIPTWTLKCVEDQYVVYDDSEWELFPQVGVQLKKDCDDRGVHDCCLVRLAEYPQRRPLTAALAVGGKEVCFKDAPSFEKSC